MKLFLGLLTLALAATTLPAAAIRPNVDLILIDDLGWTDLGCYGSDFYRTPHIDRLARDGVRFTQAYSACTVCSPTRGCPAGSSRAAPNRLTRSGPHRDSQWALSRVGRDASETSPYRRAGPSWRMSSTPNG